MYSCFVLCSFSEEWHFTWLWSCTQRGWNHIAHSCSLSTRNHFFWLARDIACGSWAGKSWQYLFSQLDIAVSDTHSASCQLSPQQWPSQTVYDLLWPSYIFLLQQFSVLVFVSRFYQICFQFCDLWFGCVWVIMFLPSVLWHGWASGRASGL